MTPETSAGVQAWIRRNALIRLAMELEVEGVSVEWLWEWVKEADCEWVEAERRMS
jgi:hypothetical protein